MSTAKMILVEGEDGSGKDAIIDLVLPLLAKRNLDVKLVRTTEPVEGVEDTFVARKVLTAPTTDPSNRFLAAFYLYHANIKAALATPPRDLLLLYRGWSGFTVYNQIPWMSQQGQSELIPDVDGAIFITADFDTLTRRIRNRNAGQDEKDQPIQDTNYDFRLSVHQRYAESFKTLSEKRQKPHLMVFNQDGAIADSVKEVEYFIVSLLGERTANQESSKWCPS